MNHVMTLGKYMLRYGMVLFERCIGSCYKTNIHSRTVSYVFLERPSVTLSWEVHVGGIAGQFGRSKTIEAVEHRFYCRA